MIGKVEICYWWDAEEKPNRRHVAYLHWGRSGTEHVLHGHGASWEAAKEDVITQFKAIPPSEELEIS
jgi:hypothetical protein